MNLNKEHAGYVHLLQSNIAMLAPNQHFRGLCGIEAGLISTCAEHNVLFDRGSPGPLLSNEHFPSAEAGILDIVAKPSYS